jgi:hypothetical protein
VDFVADEPTGADALSTRPVVVGLRQLLDDPDTALPMAVGIAGRVGTGKSTVLAMLKDELQAENPSTERAWTVVTVDLSPALNEAQTWALVISGLYAGLLGGRSRVSQLAFRWRLERIRRGHRGFFLRVVLPMFAGVIVAVGGVVTGLSEATGWLAAVAGPAGAVAAIVVLFRSSAREFTSPTGWLLGSEAPAAVHDDMPAFGRVDRELANLGEAHGPTGRPIVIIVEGLDQLEPAELPKRVRALGRIRRSPSMHPIAMVIALDREMVLACLDAVFGDVLERLRERQHPAGHADVESHLAEAIDLSIALPEPNAELVERYVTSLLGQAPPRAEPQPSDSDMTAAALDHVFTAAMPLLPANPRAFRQFALAFRLQARLAAPALPLDNDHLLLLARWVILRRRWPRLASEIDHNPTLLKTLEAEAAGASGALASPVTERARHWLTQEADLRTILVTDDNAALSDLPLEAFPHIA